MSYIRVDIASTNDEYDFAWNPIKNAQNRAKVKSLLAEADRLENPEGIEAILEKILAIIDGFKGGHNYEDYRKSVMERVNALRNKAEEYKSLKEKEKDQEKKVQKEEEAKYLEGRNQILHEKSEKELQQKLATETSNATRNMNKNIQDERKKTNSANIKEINDKISQARELSTWDIVKNPKLWLSSTNRAAERASRNQRRQELDSLGQKLSGMRKGAQEKGVRTAIATGDTDKALDEAKKTNDKINARVDNVKQVVKDIVTVPKRIKDAITDTHNEMFRNGPMKERPAWAKGETNIKESDQIGPVMENSEFVPVTKKDTQSDTMTNIFTKDGNKSDDDIYRDTKPKRKIIKFFKDEKHDVSDHFSEGTENDTEGRVNQAKGAIIGNAVKGHGKLLLGLTIGGLLAYLGKRKFDKLSAEAAEEGMGLMEYIKYKYGERAMSNLVPATMATKVDEGKPSNPLLSAY